jgi:hypothetical protein
MRSVLFLSLRDLLWTIDTGARPDRASFMLTAAVFRGVSMEGGAYPVGGSEAMALELVPVITVRASFQPNCRLFIHDDLKNTTL